MWKDKTRQWNAHLGQNEFISQGIGSPNWIGCCSDTRNMQTVPLIRIWKTEIKGLSVWQELFDGLLDDTFLCLLTSHSFCCCFVTEIIITTILSFKEGFLAKKKNDVSKYANIINILLLNTCKGMHARVRYLGTITNCNM